MRNIYKTLLYLLFVLICFGCGMDKNLSGEKYNSKSRLTNISSENSLFDDILTNLPFSILPIKLKLFNDSANLVKILSKLILTSLFIPLKRFTLSLLFIFLIRFDES